MTLDEPKCDVTFAFSRTHQQNVLGFAHLPAICTCINAEHTSVRSITARDPSSVGLMRSLRPTSLHSVPFHSLHHFAFDGMATSKSDELQSTEHCKISPVLPHRVAGVACEWLPPFLDFSRTRRDTVKRVMLSDGSYCTTRTCRGTHPIFCERRGFTQQASLISDDAAAIFTDGCKSRPFDQMR